MVVILTPFPKANAGGLDNWEFNIMGIDPKDFKDRNVFKVIGGGILSFVVHEGGHMLMGEIFNMDPSFKGNCVYVDYKDSSRSEKGLFHAGGFIATTLIGTAIVLHPETRHLDYTLGFTGWSMIHDTIIYGATGGTRDKDISDVENLNKLDYPGNAIGISSGLYSGLLMYKSLNKHK
jgi:hypothetical protein